jgi:tryptophanyl-tRNA synthetase
MRPTGALHLGHYHGVLKNWVRLQSDYDCFFFVADWHALTTHYDDPSVIGQNVWGMLIDWLAAGVDPSRATLFIQSRVPEHAELHLLLSMCTPLGWLERVPTYKDQQDKLSDRDLTTYGFLGYPLLQSADILIYRAGLVPVGEDQVPHVELTREIARRFNHVFGAEPDFETRARAALKGLGDSAARYLSLRSRFQEQGDVAALADASSLVCDAGLAEIDRERLLGFIEGDRRQILIEPQALLTEASRMPGLDGQKMSKSYNNTIAMREPADTLVQKMRRMPTDPARVRRTDAGNPERCPVWQLHQVYSDDSRREWVRAGCTSAGIGCLECKQPLIDAVLDEQRVFHDRAQPYQEDPGLLRRILHEGSEKARDVASQTMRDVRGAMGLNFG